MLDYRTALCERIIQRYKDSEFFEEEKFPHYPKQFQQKGKCQNEECNKARISTKCCKCNLFLCAYPCFGEYHNSKKFLVFPGLQFE